MEEKGSHDPNGRAGAFQRGIKENRATFKQEFLCKLNKIKKKRQKTKKILQKPLIFPKQTAIIK
ncbi:MAG: hypothetical protein PHD67_01435 [Oscillospiraceae bacterium]|nr:hypothetical protein [Oscillospiraceae bacterium]